MVFLLFPPLPPENLRAATITFPNYPEVAMALITCPNCGSKNISDYKTLCPVCGVPLSNFDDHSLAQKYQDEKNERKSVRLKIEADKTRQKTERLNKAKQSLMPELKKELDEIDNLQIPDKPRFIYALINKGFDVRISIFLFLILLVVTLCLFLFSSYLMFAIFLVLTIITAVYLIVSAYFEHQKELEKFYAVVDDFDGYKENLKKTVRKKYDKEAQNLTVYK